MDVVELFMIKNLCGRLLCDEKLSTYLQAELSGTKDTYALLEVRTGLSNTLFCLFYLCLKFYIKSSMVNLKRAKASFEG